MCDFVLLFDVYTQHMSIQIYIAVGRECTAYTHTQTYTLKAFDLGSERMRPNE